MSDPSANPAVQGGDQRAYKLRLQDRHSAKLRREARAVNAIWNYCNETQQTADRLSKGEKIGARPFYRTPERVRKSSWADFKRMLAKTAMTHGSSTLEVCRRRRSPSGSVRGSRPASWPRGIAGLPKRMFACDDCGAVLDRDVKAARNILRIGQDAPAGGAHA